ncbi:MAG: YkgJ family cysteine cluster protein [Phycisphaerae bacterium]|jgi:Fe-S-cluster containining protein
MPHTNNSRDGRALLPAEQVAACRADEGFLRALRNLYAAADTAVAVRGLACKACGACCDFARAGHRLYVSTGELALLVQTPPPQPPRAGGRCPYQVEERCTIHPRRALGCRLFFCDPPGREGSGETYEAFHARIRQLHDAHGLPYAYVELTAALAELFPAPR